MLIDSIIPLSIKAIIRDIPIRISIDAGEMLISAGSSTVLNLEASRSPDREVITPMIDAINIVKYFPSKIDILPAPVDKSGSSDILSFSPAPRSIAAGIPPTAGYSISKNGSKNVRSIIEAGSLTLAKEEFNSKA